MIQDFGGLRIHAPTLKATTGLDLDDFMVPNYSVRTATLDDVYSRSYHTIMHNHLQRLIRVLQLHYNGLGWKIVREQLSKNIPIDHPLYDAWLSPSRRTVSGKAFMVMRIAPVDNPGSYVVRNGYLDMIKLKISTDFASSFPQLDSLHRK
jgi:hypothetical protein